jgi:sugar phosphate isomerase/epimerase
MDCMVNNGCGPREGRLLSDQPEHAGPAVKTKLLKELSMKLSVMLFPFHGQIVNGEMTPGGLVEAFAGAGISALEPMLSNLDAEPKWAELLRLAKEAGMQFSCLDVGVNFIGESDADRVTAMETVKRGLDFCAEIACPVALLPGTRPAPGMSNEDGRKIYAEGLAKSAELAKPLGIITCIEDFGVYPAFACHSRDVLEVVTLAGPETMVTWDNGNFILADEMPMDALPPLWERTCHVHIKDFLLDETGQAGLKTPSGKAYKGIPIGAGDCQVRESVAELKRLNFEGWISLEVGQAPPVPDAINGAEVVRAAWDSA